MAPNLYMLAIRKQRHKLAEGARISVQFKTRIAAPATAVFAWHERTDAFEQLIPPWEPVRLISQTGGLQVGAQAILEIRLWGPFKIQWVSRHRHYEPGVQFQDQQISGPFAYWLHTHRVETLPDDPNASYLIDEIDYQLPFGWIGHLLGGFYVQKKLEKLFQYRHQVIANDLALQPTP